MTTQVPTTEQVFWNSSYSPFHQTPQAFGANDAHLHAAHQHAADAAHDHGLFYAGPPVAAPAAAHGVYTPRSATISVRGWGATELSQDSRGKGEKGAHP